jgi:hypothetical protein
LKGGARGGAFRFQRHHVTLARACDDETQPPEFGMCRLPISAICSGRTNMPLNCVVWSAWDCRNPDGLRKGPAWRRLLERCVLSALGE